MSTEATWLTPAAFEKLQAELTELTTTGRKEISARIAAAREEGDLKENGGYHAAREEQGKMEARIRDLEALLRDAVVQEAPESTGVVAVGTVVTAQIAGRPQRFLLGSKELSASAEIPVYSPETPMGKAILGLAPGATASYQAPTGMQITVEVIAVETYQG